MQISRILLIIILGFILRITVSAWNGIWGPSFGAGVDAQMFHLAASEYSKDLNFEGFVIGHFYSSFLGFFYYLTNDSLLLGSILSSVVWLGSAFVLLKSLKLFSISTRHKILAILIFSLLPSSILFTSVTLRESYQLFFVNLSIYSALKIHIDKSRLHWLYLTVGILGLGTLHGALLVFGVFIAVSTIFLNSYRPKGGISIGKLFLFSPVLVAVVIIGYSVFDSVSYDIGGGLSQAILSFQEGSIGSDGRATYKTDVQINGLPGMVNFFLTSFLQYLLEPMPWRISNAFDVVKSLENLIRIWVFFIAIRCLRKAQNKDRTILIFLTSCYLFTELLWAIGTTNWGTAARHHVPSIGLLLVTSFSYANAIYSSPRRREKSIAVTFQK